MKSFRFALLGLFFPLLLNAQLGFTLTGKKKYAEIPIEICNNLIIVPVILNGILSLKFILDTGVRTTILTEKSFGNFLNLTYSRHYSIAGLGGKKTVEADVANGVTIDILDVHGTGHTLLVLEQDYLQLRNYLGIETHGILGYELFSRFIVQINYQEKKLILSNPEKFKPRRIYTILPISIEDTKPYVRATIEIDNEQMFDVNLLIDTGASHGLLLDSSTDEKIVIPSKNIASIIGRGLGGVITGNFARINSIQIGKYKIDNVITNFPDANQYGDSLNANSYCRNGSLGGEILSRFMTIYNFSNGKLYITKNRSFKRKFYFNMSGITVKAKGINLRCYEVADIREGSVAEKADIHIGDEILAINGIFVYELDLSTLTTYLNTRHGKRIRILLLREKEKLTKKIILESVL